MDFPAARAVAEYLNAEWAVYRGAHSTSWSLAETGPAGAYWPLGASEPGPERARMRPFRFLAAESSRSTLLVWFRWLVEDDQCEYLLPVDLADWPDAPLREAANAVFERVVSLLGAADWRDRFIVRVSSRVAVVVPPTQ